ncbi:hypothetical protein [Thalassospira alkalitolerans]|uniref:hypothetical protein n=1 Tax=Thalassospira alkalitolerans TaxID=1293890 RepID=UPI003AA8D2CF
MTDPTKDYETAKIEAEHLARKLHREHYSHLQHWNPAPDLTGMLIQIGQMTHGLVKIRRAA